MAAVGLVWGEIGIGASVYGGLQEFGYPTAEGMRIVHLTSLSTVFPTKEAGHQQPAVSGVMRMTAANIAAFIADVRAGTSERKVSFLMGDVECYGYAKSGDITGNKCLNFEARGAATRVHEVSFSFPLTRSKLYKASDDSVLWGS